MSRTIRFHLDEHVGNAIADFLVLANLGLTHPGIVYCKQNTRSIGEIVAGLELIWEICEPREMVGRIEFI